MSEPASSTSPTAELPDTSKRTIDITLGHNIDAHPQNAAKQLAYLDKMAKLGELDRYDDYRRSSLRRQLLEKHRCEDCGRALEDPESRRHGVGRDCLEERRRKAERERSAGG